MARKTSRTVSGAVPETTNKDGEPWCPSCGTVFDGEGKVLREGHSDHDAECDA